MRKESTGELIGMGRIVGDGGTSYQVVDVAVAAEFQGKGFGKKIMMELMLYIQKYIDPLAYVSLIAVCPANKLYEQFGFVETSPKSIGMYFKRS
ncbi:GNAT family N-acetyltransferase [Enterococcus rivorum]|uniref:GNAT family N-acetyltransferase n=1 Tax=Enterococcus rivorum TaxID=762845 RepID=UPI00247FC59A|nr:GNAT family N-acetyltransferase [Enterococcus rivorum]